MSFEPSSASVTPDLRSRANYRPDIDGLRALAIIPVVIFHAFPAILPGGFVGVDVFLVISGFLISSIIVQALQRGSFQLRRLLCQSHQAALSRTAACAGCMFRVWMVFPAA
jgi:acyltransferase-like protein